MDDFYEPWQPQVGQRVRYRWQPECPGVYANRPPIGHPRAWDGLTGTVYERLPHTGHAYLVLLDAPTSAGLDHPTSHLQCAALELEPIDA